VAAAAGAVPWPGRETGPQAARRRLARRA